MKIPSLALFLCLNALATSQVLPGTGVSKSQAPMTSLNPVNEYPQEAVVVEHFFRSFRFENDGSAITKTRVEYKVQSEAGVQELGILQLAYNSVSDEVKIDYVRVKKKDGVVINTPTESAQEGTSNVSQVAPMYTDMKIRYLPIVGLRPGDTLEYQYTTATKKPAVPGQFFLTENFEKDAITKDEVLELDVPAARKIKLKMEPGATPEIKEENGRKVYRWRHANLKRKEAPKKGEPAATESEDEQVPSVQVSSLESWEDVGRWYWALQQPRVTVSPEMQAKAVELTKGATTDAEKIARIYDFVSKEFRYIGLEFGAGRYQPHDATEVYASKYGDCKDKHTLLAAMLKAVGYDAAPVLINSSRKLDLDVPSPSQFDHVISLVHTANRDYWMDTTPEVAPFGLLMAGLRKKNALVVQSAESAKIMETPADPPFATERRLEVEGSINDLGKLEAKITQSWRGDIEVLIRGAFRRTPQPQWKDLAQNLSYSTGWGGEVTDLTASDPTRTEKPFEYSYKYSREKYVDWTQVTGTMTIALTPVGLPAPAEEISAKAKAMPLGGAGDYTMTAKIKLPEGTSAFAPQGINIDREFASYHSTYKFLDGIFSTERRLTVKMREVPPSLDAEYQAFFRSVQDDEGKTVQVWRKAGGIAAVPTSSTATELLEAGDNALKERDFPTAIKVFQRLTEMEPKHPTAWAGLGQAQMATMKVADAIAALRKQMEVNPSHENAYLMLAMALSSQSKYDESAQVLSKRLESDPKDTRARMALASVYVDAGKSAQAVPYLEQSVKDYPDDQNLQLKLATAYLESGNNEKAVPAFDQVVRANPTPAMKNNIAYLISVKNVSLDKAEELAKSALAALAEHLRTVDLANLSNDDLAQNNLQIATWDTLGWIYKQEGKLKDAESYIHSAWLGEQNREIGDHLAEIYHLEGRTDEEGQIRQIASTLKTPPKNLAEAFARAKSQATPPEGFTPPVFIRRGAGNGQQGKPKKAAGSGKTTPIESLQEMRTVKITRKLKESVSAELFVLMTSPGAVADVKIIHGDDQLKGWMDTFKGLNYRTEIPEAENTKLVRRAVVSCAAYNGECMLVILPQEMVTNVN